MLTRSHVPILVCLALVSIPLYAIAHGNAASLERMSGPYLVDIGFDQTPIAGEEILIDFSLIQDTSSAQSSMKPYSLLQVSITQNGKQIFAKDIAREDFGKTFIVYTFSRAGTYELSARFMDGDTQLSDESFTVAVAPGQGTEIPWPAVGIAGAGIGVMLIGAVYMTRKVPKQ